MIENAKEVLILACKKAGKFQLEHFDKPIKAEMKESISSVVTFVDLESEKIIIDEISTGFPFHNILSEECGFIDKKSEYTWIVDPLDGTSNYSAGLPWFGVLIALMKGNETILGGAYLPVQDQLFIGEKGKGAYLNDKKLKLKEKPLSDCLFAFSTDFTEDESYLDNGIQWFRYLIQHARNVRTTNSLVDLVNVATGKLGGCINLFNCIWDIAATSLIMREAGAEITSLDGTPLDFNVSEVGVKQNYAILSGNKMAYSQLRKIV